MICYNCNLTSICKIFEIITNMLPSINIVVNNCQVCHNNDAKAMTVPAFTDKPIVRSQNDLLSISAKIKNLEQDSDHILKTNAINTVTQQSVAKCTVCNTELFENNLVECVVCKKNICSNCATYSMISQNNYCETCWDTIPATPLSD